MYITLYSFHISETLKSDHSSYRSFMSFLRKFLPRITRHALRLPRFSFSAFYVFSLKFIYSLVLMSVKYEYYGICVENWYLPVGRE